MSIFSAIGSAFKTVGKVALGGVKAAANVATNSVGIGPVFNVTGNNGGAQQAQPQSVTPPSVVTATSAATNGGAVMASTPSLLDLGKYALGSIGDFLSGRSHVQVDANVGAGGRVADMPGTGSSLPSWLLPAGLIGGLGLFLMSRNSGGGRSRRY